MSDLSLVKAARAAIVWRNNTGTKAIVQAARYFGWVVWFPLEFCKFLLTEGADAKNRLGRNYADQISDLLRVAAINGTMPRDYYAGDLARHGGSEEIFGYLPVLLYQTVARHLLFEGSATDVAHIGDKHAVEIRCRDLGLPVVRTVAIAYPDAVLLPVEERKVAALPPRDLLVKPVDGHQGKDIERWRHVSRGQFKGADGETISGPDLLAHLSALSRSTGSEMLVQLCLENSSELQSISGAALSTTRFVTFLDENDQPEIVEAYYRTSFLPSTAVDSYHNGSVLFPLDIKTGRLADGRSESRGAPGPIVEHPETGSTVSGAVLPGWEEMSTLALRAHRLFSGLPFVGWDIAYCPDGPVIVEVNTLPEKILERRQSSQALVGTRFFALLAFHARRWLEDTEPRNSRWRCESETPIVSEPK